MTRQDERGVSAVLAIVLLVGIVAVGSIGILLIGADATNQTRTNSENERTRLAFEKLDSEMDAVARQDETSQVVDVGLGDEQGGAVRERDAGRIVVTRTNITAGHQDELVNRSIGAITYADNGKEFAIQAGGVWQGSGNGTQMVSAPAFSYATTKAETEPTLTMPIVETSGDRRLADDEVRITHNETVSPLNDVTVVEGDLITVRVQSRYYVGWADYFRQMTTEAGVTLDHRNRTVIVEMIVPTIAPPVEGGVVMGAAAERLKLKQEAVVDSYNSTEGKYSNSHGQNTRVVSAGEVIMQQDSRIEGSLEADSPSVDLNHNATITGDLRLGTSTTFTHDDLIGVHVGGWWARNASVGTRTAVDGVIDRNVQLVREDNDNSTSGNVSGGSLDNCNTGNGCRLDSGAYFLDEIDLDGTEKLILDTTGGPVYVVVNGKVQLSDDARIEVKGGGRANVYINSETGSEDFSMKNDAQVKIPKDRAPQLWIYMDSDAEAKLRQQVEFTGVIYGPGPGDESGADIRMSSTSQLHVYGAVVGDVAPITQEVRVHYDEALATETPVTTATAIPRLTFLHVSVYRVDVENAD